MRTARVVVFLAACTGSQPAAVTPAAPVTLAAATPTSPPAATPPPPERHFAPSNPPAFRDPDRRTKLAAAFPAIDKAMAEELAQEHVLGVSVGIVIDGELAYAKGFGIVDPATKTVPDADTVYRIGSISKSFTGLSILALRDDGALTLGDTLAKWIPEANGLTYPTRDASPITLRELATHTSGLPRMGPFEPESGPDEAIVVGSLAKTALERPPGLASVYSNFGFSLLGIVVGHAAKQSLHDFIATRIWKPLGMTSSGWEASTVPAGHLAPALSPANTVMPPARLGAADGAGGIYSSVRDMGRYAAFLLAAYPARDEDDRGPIRRATIREAHMTGFALEPHGGAPANPKAGEPLVDVDASSYGFGFARHQTCTTDDAVGHNGAIDSYRAELLLRTSSGVGVVVLTNFGNADTGAFARRAMEALQATGGMKPREASESPAFAALLPKFVEVYNAFDEAKLSSILARPIDPVERGELEGYKALHGACRGFALKTARDPNLATFALACERGSLDVTINLQNGKIAGFSGRSPGVAPPAKVRATFDAAIALQTNPKWTTVAYKKVFPKDQIPEQQAKTFSAGLLAQFGACKAGAFSHEGLGWTNDLVCPKGGPLALTIQFANDELTGIQYHPPTDGGEPKRCPTK